MSTRHRKTDDELLREAEEAIALYRAGKSPVVQRMAAQDLQRAAYRLFNIAQRDCEGE